MGSLFPEITLLLSLLALVANALVVATFLFWLLGRVVPRAEAAFAALRGAVGAKDGLRLAAAAALVASAGSLWLSELVGFPPCRLCWFQRTMMYPLALILPLAARRGDLAVRVYALPLALIGFAVSCWHYGVEHLPLPAGNCEATVPCSVPAFERLGFVSVPYLAASAFALAIVALLLPRGHRPGKDPSDV